MVSWVTFLLACAPRTRNDSDRSDQHVPNAESDADTDADADTDSDTDTDTDSDTDADTDFDCESDLPPSPPYGSRTIDGSATSEDLDVDNDGYIVGSDRMNLYRSSGAGDLDMILPNVFNPQAIVVLPTDDVVFYSEGGELLERLDPKGERHLIVSGLSVPYGAAAPSGVVYASFFDTWVTGADAILRIDPFENEVEEILDWDHDFPWGITFNEDYSALYVSVVQGYNGFVHGQIRIWKVNLDEEGYVDGDPELFVEFTGGTMFSEGLAVDVCGNVYVSLGSKIVRVSKDGTHVDDIWIDDDSTPHGLDRAVSGLAFGRKGEGGTDPLKLYASNPYGKYAIEIDAGVYGKSAW